MPLFSTEVEQASTGNLQLFIDRHGQLNIRYAHQSRISAIFRAKFVSDSTRQEVIELPESSIATFESVAIRVVARMSAGASAH